MASVVAVVLVVVEVGSSGDGLVVEASTSGPPLTTPLDCIIAKKYKFVPLSHPQLMSVMRAPSSANGHAHSAGSHGVTPCIEDPLDVKNDVGRGSFQFYRVKSAFEEAYITLTRYHKLHLS